MFDGNMLRAATGTPMRSTALANSPFAAAEPEPLTFANLTTKSLMRSSGRISVALIGGELGYGPLRRGGQVDARRIARVRRIEEQLLHVPRAGRASLCAKTAVQADVLVLGHDAAG